MYIEVLWKMTDYLSNSIYIASLVQILSGMVIGYIIASVVESYLHNKIFHATVKTVQFWKRYPKIFGVFINARYSHHTIHHFKTYRKDHITQFTNDDEKQKLDDLLKKQGRDLIIKEDYGTTLVLSGTFNYLFPIFPFFAVLAFFLPAMMVIGMLLTVFLSPLASAFLHPYTHMKYNDGLNQAGFLMRCLLRTTYIKGVLKNHYLHHKYTYCNYNLILGGDILLGFTRKPGENDLVEMRELGLINPDLMKS